MNVTFKGQPVTLEGPEVNVGDAAPDFTVIETDMSTVTLDDVTDHGKKNALLIVVPSLDTGVCSLESQKFNTRIGELPPDVTAFVVSRDLPFAQARWAKDQGDVKLRMLSDYRDHTFGPAYGVLVKELGLLARSIFIVGKDKTIKYRQIVPEIGQEPDYEDVIAAALRTSSAVNA
ncbi:MAG TPA: thiol peroxidase [Candidatus Baltobacteraceae bacterium]|nr:thiol peroxidase [Candidatus Baltobacteraceae bacterium]